MLRLETSLQGVMVWTYACQTSCPLPGGGILNADVDPVTIGVSADTTLETASCRLAFFFDETTLVVGTIDETGEAAVLLFSPLPSRSKLDERSLSSFPYLSFLGGTALYDISGNTHWNKRR